MGILYYGAVHLSIHLSEHPFPHDNSKSFTAFILIPGIWLPHRPPRMTICFGVVTLIFKVTEVTKVKLSFWSIPQSFRAVNSELGTDTCPGSSKMSISLVPQTLARCRQVDATGLAESLTQSVKQNKTNRRRCLFNTTAYEHM